MILGRVLKALIVAASILAVSAFGDDEIRMNQVQFVATHNSYHVAQDPPRNEEWAYSFPPLDEQLDMGVRGFEIDVYFQPDGYFKVMHVPLLDHGTTCDRFTDCLTVIREWSKANPNHIPIITHIEVKDEQYPIATKILPVNGPELDVLDAEVRSVFGDAQLLTPDDVRGDAATLNGAITKRGWPLLKDVRGKCVFVLHNRGRHREAFIEKTPTLEGRALFTMSEPGAPDAAFLLRDRPAPEVIQPLVREGYMIRTRDGGPGNPERKDTAAATGAHLVSTDYPMGWPHDESGYFVALPGDTTIRCNPVNAPEGCDDAGLEPPAE